jgi:hypothetical protein
VSIIVIVSRVVDIAVDSVLGLPGNAAALPQGPRLHSVLSVALRQQVDQRVMAPRGVSSGPVLLPHSQWLLLYNAFLIYWTDRRVSSLLSVSKLLLLLLHVNVEALIRSFAHTPSRVAQSARELIEFLGRIQSNLQLAARIKGRSGVIDELNPITASTSAEHKGGPTSSTPSLHPSQLHHKHGRAFFLSLAHEALSPRRYRLRGGGAQWR